MNNEAQIRDIHAPIDLSLSTEIQILLYIGGVFLLISSGGAFYFWLQWRKKTPPQAHSAQHRALKELEATAHMFMEPGKDRQFCATLSGIIRAFIENNFDTSMKEMTTEEFLERFSKNPKFKGHPSHLLSTFLTICDLVKFAHQSLEDREKRELLEKARTFIITMSKSL